MLSDAFVVHWYMIVEVGALLLDLSGVGRDAPSDLPGRAASPERSRRDLKERRLERSVSSDRQRPGRSATNRVSPGGPGDGSLRAHCPAGAARSPCGLQDAAFRPNPPTRTNAPH